MKKSYACKKRTAAKLIINLLSYITARKPEKLTIVHAINVNVINVYAINAVADSFSENRKCVYNR